MHNFSQEQIFVLFFIVGLIIGIIFDFFRAIRKNYKACDFITLVEDILFLGFASFLIIFSIIRINGGEIRFYLFLAIFFGILLYSLTISNLCVIIFSVIVRICKNMLQIPSLVFKKVVKSLKKTIKNFEVNKKKYGDT